MCRRPDSLSSWPAAVLQLSAVPTAPPNAHTERSAEAEMSNAATAEIRPSSLLARDLGRAVRGSRRISRTTGDLARLPARLR